MELLRLLSDNKETILNGRIRMDWGDMGGGEERCGSSGWVGEENLRSVL